MALDENSTLQSGDGGTAAKRKTNRGKRANKARREVAEDGTGLESLRSRIDLLQKRRQEHIDGVTQIDDDLKEVRDTLNGILGQSSDEPTPQPTRGRPVGSTKSGRGRSGKGTQIILEMLRKAKGGTMATKDIVSKAKAQGIRYPNSSLQSLQARNVIKTGKGANRGMIKLLA
jgi:hypothetical protein